MTKPSKERRIKWEMQLAEDFQWLAQTAQGRRILAWMFGWGMVFQEIEETDPIRLAMAVGENNFAKRIARYATASPQVFIDAMKQNEDVARGWMGDKEYEEQMRAYYGLTSRQTMDS